MRTIVSIILALFLMVVAVNPTYNRESFESAPVVTITSANVADYIYKIYRADVKAIQNLADIAAQLQAGGITCPGAMTISGTLTAGNSTLGTIASPTITDLYNKIAALEGRCAALEGKCTALEGRCQTLENRCNTLESKTSTMSSDGTCVTFTGDCLISSKLYFHTLKKAWIQDGVGNYSWVNMGNMVAGNTISFAVYNTANNEPRMIWFTQDGNVCGHTSGRGPRCSLS